MSKHFREQEWECKCGCGMSVSEELKDKMERVREALGEPIIITSGARCPAHNKAVGGVPDSSHAKGLAVDISCSSSRYRFNLINALRSVGFNRIGVASNFVHADIDKDKDEFVLWHYKS